MGSSIAYDTSVIPATKSNLPRSQAQNLNPPAIMWTWFMHPWVQLSIFVISWVRLPGSVINRLHTSHTHKTTCGYWTRFYYHLITNHSRILSRGRQPNKKKKTKNGTTITYNREWLRNVHGYKEALWDNDCWFTATKCYIHPCEVRMKKKPIPVRNSSWLIWRQYSWKCLACDRRSTRREQSQFHPLWPLNV